MTHKPSVEPIMVNKMPKTDRYETELLAAFERSTLKSIATKSELSKFKAVARATAIKDGT